MKGELTIKPPYSGKVPCKLFLGIWKAISEAFKEV